MAELGRGDKQDTGPGHNTVRQNLKNVLMEKAEGSIHTKVANGEEKGGVYIYTDIYKWFTETSGLGLCTQAMKLMDPEPVKKEEELTEKVEEWIQKLDRMAKCGSQHDLPAIYKTVALRKMLTGESRRMYENWRLEGMSFDRLLVKLKEYARSKRLDGEASKGKQAVDLSRVQNWADEETVEGTEGVTINEMGPSIASTSSATTAVKRGTPLSDAVSTRR